MVLIKYLWYLLNTINFIKGNVMILLVGGRKGGSGKSTIAMNICAALAQVGKDVMLVDADKQASSAGWSLERSTNKPDKTALAARWESPFLRKILWASLPNKRQKLRDR